MDKNGCFRNSRYNTLCQHKQGAGVNSWAKPDEKEFLRQTTSFEKEGTLAVDEAFLARQISDIVPNPWISYSLGGKAIQLLKTKYSSEIIASSFVFVIEELKKILEKQRNKLAENVFRQWLEKKKLHFFLVTGHGGFFIPNHIKVKGNKPLMRKNFDRVQKSLFEGNVEEEFDKELEKTVAVYLDEQEQLLWWYWNRARKDFHIQGWKKNRIWPDFVAAKESNKIKDDYDTVFVLETKGIHLAGNEDTEYKRDVFKLCNELGAKKPWTELFNEFLDHKFEFQVISGDEWQNRINGLMA